MHQEMTKSQITRLAKSLSHAAGIPSGNDLVWLVGNGQERDNLEAIETWLQRTLKDTNLELADELLPELVNRLVAQLTLDKWLA